MKDGSKPIRCRVLPQMKQIGLTPGKGHVEFSCVVGEVMGKLHPYGDVVIYDALVHLVQPLNLRAPLVGGHGSFGPPNNGPVAVRYTEARLAQALLCLTEDLDEGTMDLVSSYDNQFQ